MAIGAAPRGAGPLACTIHIWPSRGLVAQSWQWSAAWHEAFERSAGLLALAAAMCVLNGRPLSERPLESLTSLGHLKYTVVRRGESILITITEFTGPESPGPDSPGPNGGARQPSAIDGMVLGLRGAGRNYRLVVFHGFMPSIPAINAFGFDFIETLFSNARKSRYITNRGKIELSTGDIDPSSLFADPISIAHMQNLSRAAENTAARNLARGKSNACKPIAMLPEFFCNECYSRLMLQHELLRQPNHEQRQAFFSPEMCDHCLQIPQQHRQSQFNVLYGRYLH
jgi:hypothetical protein